MRPHRRARRGRDRRHQGRPAGTSTSAVPAASGSCRRTASGSGCSSCPRPAQSRWGDADGRSLYVTALTSIYRMRLAPKEAHMSRNLEPGTTIPDFELPTRTAPCTGSRSCRATTRSCCTQPRRACPRERQHHRAAALPRACRSRSPDRHDHAQHQQDEYRLKTSTGARWTSSPKPSCDVQRHFDINEYTDAHHDYAGVPHTLILSPGLVIEKVYVGYGSGAARPTTSSGPISASVPPHEARLRSDHHRSSRRVGGEPD